MAATRNKCVASQLGDKGDHCGEDHCLKKYIKRLYYHGDMLSNIYTLASLQRNVTLLWKEEVTCDLLFYEQDTSLKKKK